MTTTKLDDFTTAYIEAMLWSTTAEIYRCESCKEYVRTPDVAEDDSPEATERKWCPTCESEVKESDASFQDAGFDADDLAPETLERIIADCTKFQAENESLLIDDNCPGSLASALVCAGHDFWLTRVGHGAGFWDGDWNEPTATELDNASKAFGNVDLYVGDDGKLYLS